jgi:putative endonuclease
VLGGELAERLNPSPVEPPSGFFIEMSRFYVYILYSPSFGKFYVGQTDDVESRLKRHNDGFVKSTAPYIPWLLECIIEKESRGEAILLERKLKNLNKGRIRDFIFKALGPEVAAMPPSRERSDG